MPAISAFGASINDASRDCLPFALMATSTTVAAWLIYSIKTLHQPAQISSRRPRRSRTSRRSSKGNYFELSADAQPLLHTWSLCR